MQSLARHNSVLHAVVTAMEKIAPLSLAESSWDNVGVLLEAPPCSVNTASRKVLLTIDLTRNVIEPYIKVRPSILSVVVAYHPFLFKPMKRITLEDEKQSIALDCCANGISVYSPHTALDNAVGGINEMLARDIAGTEASVKWLKPYKDEQGRVIGGSGTLAELKELTSLNDLLGRVKTTLGLAAVRVASYRQLDEKFISKVAFCAGSGASVLKGCDADVLLSGEMSHHEVLDALALGKSVVLCEHTNTERFYLQRYLRPKLLEIFKASKETSDIEVIVSDRDRDPIVFC